MLLAGKWSMAEWTTQPGCRHRALSMGGESSRWEGTACLGPWACASSTLPAVGRARENGKQTCFQAKQRGVSKNGPCTKDGNGLN